MNYDSFENWIGYSYFLHQCEVITTLGRELLNNQFFIESVDSLNLEHERIRVISLWDENKVTKIKNLLFHCKDIRNTFYDSKLRTLSLVELYEIKLFCITVEKLIESVDSLPELELLSVYKILDIIDPKCQRKFEFCIDDSFSNSILDIRKRKNIIEHKLYEDYSDTLLSERNRIILEEKNEEERVCSLLSKKISVFTEDLIKNSQIIAELDLLICKSELLKKYDMAIPIITNDSIISFSNMFHPQIVENSRENGNDFVPLTMDIEYGSTVVTGANMGGKSVLLKTLALNVYLAMIGWPVFANNAMIPVVSDIKCIFSNNDNITTGLSAFGSEMKQLKDILENIVDYELILIDEPARGTNPYEGTAIVKGITDYFNNKNV